MEQFKQQMVEAKKRERSETLKKVKELCKEFGFKAEMLKGSLAEGRKKNMDKHEEIVIELAESWKRSGVSEGDTLLVHSNIKRTLINTRRQGFKLMPEHVLDSFLLAVGQDGTLLLPLFNFDFPNTKVFDLRNTPSRMGALTEIARHRKQSVRTGHPIYSFAVIGRERNAFKDINNVSGYGNDSPFALLHKLDGKIASLDLEDQNSMTFYHYIEEMNAVDYRYYKEFTGKYIDLQGNESERTYKLFVRDLEKDVRTHVTPAGELMWKNGLYHGDRPKQGTGLRTVNASQMYNFISFLIKNGEAEGNLYKYGDNQ